MKINKKIICIYLILIMLFTTLSVQAYFTSEYSLSIPKEFIETEDGVFESSSGDNITIAKETLKDEELFEFNQTNMKDFSKSFLEGMLEGLEETNIQVNNKEIITEEIISIGSGNYKTMHLVYSFSNNNGTVYSNNYLIGYNKTILVITINSNKNTSYNSNIKDMISSLKINNYKEIKVSNEAMFNAKEIILSFVITIVSYCLVPTILRITKGRMDYKKGKKIIIINNAIVWIVFTIIKSNAGIAQRSFAYLTYYYVNKLILLKKEDEEKNNISPDKNNEISKDKELDIQSQKEENLNVVEKETVKVSLLDSDEIVIRDRTNDFNTYSEDVRIHKETDKKYCTNCGKIIEDTWAFCNYCGNKLK